MWTAERLRQIEMQRKAPKPPPEAIPEQAAIPKPERQRWKQVPPEVQQKVQDELRKGTQSHRIAQLFAVSPRTVSRIKVAMDR
jgi:DNA-binding NarL/FixJ family response regulator